MAKFNIKITANNQEALNKTNEIKKSLAEISKSPVKITVDSQSLDAAVKKLEEASNAARSTVQEAARITNATKQASQGTKQAAGEIADSYNNVTTTIKKVDGELSSITKVFKGSFGEQKKVVQEFTKEVDDLGNQIVRITETVSTQMRKPSSATEAQIRAYEKYKSSIGDTAPLRRQIDAITGVSSGFKSATESAKVFRNNFAINDAAIARNQELTKAVSEVGLSFKSATESAKVFSEHGLTDLERGLNTAAVQAGRATQGLGELIDKQEVWKDGQLVKAVDTYRDSLGNVTKVTSELDGATARVTQTQRTNSEQLKKQADAAEIAAKRNTLLGDSLDRIVAKIVAWQVINASVAALIRSFTDALKTMKAVDDELTNIQKVSDLTSSEIAKLGDTAYDTASKYGVAAEEYLKAVYTFQKAGLGDSAQDMGELAIKTMLVGDTTADVATKFLIAANAAWKYGGDIQKLSRLVDEADYLNNNYAVSLSDIAEALPIVASTAAQAGLTAEQTMSAITTIVSATAQSGTRVGTALRAIIMNLAGETGELENGVKVTEETMKSLNGIIAQFRPNAIAAAEAAGTIIDPMEAVAALGEAVEKGVINSGELFNIVSELGGKLRANQLAALVTSQETYNKALAGTAEAAGTADKEIGVMLSSWDSKTQILSNTWTKFLTHFVNSNGVKAFLDVAIAGVELLDSDFGKAAVTVGIFSVGLSLLYSKVTTLSFSNLQIGLAGLIISLSNATTATEVFTAIWNASPLAVIGVAAAVIYGIVAAVNALNITLEEHAEAMNEAIGEYKDADSQITDLTAKIEENNKLIEDSNELGANTAYQERLRVENERLQQQLDIQKERRRLALEEAAREATATLGTRFTVRNGLGYATGTGADRTVDILEYARLLQTASYSNAPEFQEQFDGLIDKVIAARDALLLYNEANEGLSADQAYYLSIADEIIGTYVASINAANGAAEATSKYTDALQDETKASENEANALKSLADIYNELKEQAEPLGKALNELNNKGVITSSTFDKLIEQYPELADGAEATAEGWVLSKEALEAQITALKANYQTVYDNAVNAANEILNSENAKQQSIDRTTQSVYDQIQALGRLYGLKMEEARENALERYGNDAIGRRMAASDSEVKKWEALYYEAANAGINLRTAESNLRNANTAITGLTSGGSSSKGNSGGSSSSAKDEELERLKEIVKLRESELSFLKASGASEDEQISKIKEIQEALHLQADYMRSIGADQADINALGTKWWSLQKDIANIQEKMAKTLREQIATTLEDIGNALVKQKDDMLDPLNAELDALKNAHDAAKDRREEEEKILAVEQARIALENAQKERNVRVYNANTEQWEWQANSKTVEEAQKKLADAQTELAEYYADAEYEAAKSALEQRIKDTGEAVDKVKTAFSDAAKAVKDGTMDFAAAFAMLSAEIKSVNDKYGLGFSSSLRDFKESVPSQARKSVLSRMQENSAAWHTASAEEKQRLADENLVLGTAQGWTRKADGRWYDASGKPVYDNGGILHGMGGIKATAQDEMILPPEMTKAVVDVEHRGDFERFISHLGIVTSAANAIRLVPQPTNVNRYGIGTQNNSSYTINGMEFKNITGGTTISELAQMARNLALV